LLLCQNGKWQSQWQVILSGGVLKWEVAVKVVDNFNCWFVKVAKKFKWWCVKWEVVVSQMGSGSQNGG
jgi:hypothetical protein